MTRVYTSAVFFASLVLAQSSGRSTDPSGHGLRVPRVRIIHSSDSSVPGTSMHLQQTDPWLAYAIGRSYFEREWSHSDGVFSQFGKGGDPLAEAAANSCAMCHNLPFRTPGSGGTVAEPGSYGRNTPQLFGIGLIETLGIQIRQQLLNKYDTNHNGFLDYPAEVAGKEAIIEAAPGILVNLGALYDRTNDGLPGLNDVVQVTLVDRHGKRVVGKTPSEAVTFKTPGVAGYDIALGVITSSSIVDQEPSIRLFVTNAMAVVLGLPVTDGTLDGPRDQLWSRVSNAGAPQRVSPRNHGCKAVSEGEIDLLEWFLVNHPSPAMAEQTAVTRRGRELLRSMECTKCHIENWQIQPADERTGMPGDRRFFALDATFSGERNRLEGRVKMLTQSIAGPGGTTIQTPRRDGYLVEGLYSDLLHHDLGERFHEYRMVDGKLVATHRFRTTPLWGAGSTAPYGHDGRSTTLDDVIRRHGGEAAESAEKYVRASRQDRAAVVAFLQSLILYQTDTLPTDINGDGKIDGVYQTVNGPAGPERFDPELLFRIPPKYRGWTALAGANRFFSYELLNAPEAYGRVLPGLIDRDSDGVPDIAGCGPQLLRPTSSR